MVQQISSKPIDCSRYSASNIYSREKLPAAFRLATAIAAVLMLIAVPDLRSESLASKNKKGNRFFAQGKYEDAEKAYLDAQVKSPGRPEVLYNLGNSLIKQNKFAQGVQSLHQSMSKGNKEIRENSWYNAGNALFSEGNFKDSAESFIQALRLNPNDKDAKHNLELALLKLKQQQQKNSEKQSQTGKEHQKQSNKESQNGTGRQNDKNAATKEQMPGVARREGSISKEQALQILNALQSREIEEQRKLMERRTGSAKNERDW
jgi:tetratricopeptide (TPR) repeat protein